MKRLISIEWMKLKRLNSLKIILLVYIVLFPLVLFGLTNFFGNIFAQILGSSWNPYEFPDIWKFTTYSSSYFNVLMGVVIVIVVTNEYNFKTFRQNVIDGMSVKEFIIGKFFVVLGYSTIITVYTALVALIFGLFNTATFDVLNGIKYLFIYYLQTLCYFSFAFFFAVLLKKPALSIILFIVAFIAETIIGTIMALSGLETVYAFFPLNVFSKLTPLPIFKELLENAQTSGGNAPFMLHMNLNIVLSVVYMALFFFIALRVIKKRDL